MKKLAHIALSGPQYFRPGSGRARHHQPGGCPPKELESHTVGIAREIASRHLAPLEHHKITVQMGRDLPLAQAIQLDQLVGQRMRRAMDPLDNVESYLKSQKGGPNLSYKRPDV